MGYGPMSPPGVLRRRPAKLAIDMTLLAGFTAVFLTRERSFDADYLLHGWAGIFLVPIVAVHLWSNRGWIARVKARGRRDRDFRLGALNVLLGGLVAICTLSGVPLWLDWSDSGLLVGLHSTTGMLTILTIAAHLIWNQRRFRALLHRSSRSTSRTASAAPA